MILACVANTLMEYNIETRVEYNIEPHIYGNLVYDRGHRLCIPSHAMYKIQLQMF